MKKQSQLLLLLGLAGVGAFLFLRKRGTDAMVQKDQGDETPEEIKPDAEVTAPKGQFFDALDKAQNIAQTIKDTAIYVTDGKKEALVTSGSKKKRVKRSKTEPGTKCFRRKGEKLRMYIQKNCKDLTGKDLRLCKKKARRYCTKIVVEPTQDLTFTK